VFTHLNEEVFLNTFRSVLFAAVCLAVLLAPSAAAQALPFSISTYQGNGQMVVSTACASANANAGAYTFQFQPLVVKVVDANGQFAPDNTAVNWSMQYGNGYLASFQTVTTGGLTSNSYSANWVSGSPATPFIQSTISASVASSIATFHETQELGQALGVCSSRFSITPQVPISGVAGSQASDIQVSVNDPNTGGIPNVEVQLVNSQSNPSVSCATGSGADPGTVLTDATGSATCTPILAGSGTGIFLVLVGGSADIPQVKFPPCNEQFADGGGAFGFGSSASCLLLTVTAPTPGSIGSPGGNNQTAYAGQALGSELTAIVKDTNGNTLEGQTVNWTCTPATAGTFKQPSTISDNNGQVANGFTFSASANGNITITATIAGTNLQLRFSVTAMQLVTPQYLQKVSGDIPVQTAASGQPFPNPLVVQVNLSNGLPANGVTVSFTISGPASFTTISSPSTDSSGRASVGLTALTITSQATVTVTASVAGLTPVTFQLIVIPPGPVTTANSFANAADQKVGSVSPCSLATVTGAGIAPNIQGTIVGAAFGPGPTTLQGDSISFPANGTSIQAPIFSISNNSGTQSLTFQVPCEVTGGTVLSVVVTVGGGSATVNLPILAASPGVYGAVGPDGVTRAVLARPDGSFVSLANPARRGETVTAFVNGLGPTTPPVATNQIPPRGTAATVNGTVVPGVAGGGALLYSQPQLTPDLVGVYQVSFVIPANVNSGNNVGFSIGLIPVGASTALYSSLMYIPIGQ
jgi:uncharacterized protein (TIGR03437 family)